MQGCDVAGYAEDLFGLAITAEDRADLHMPPFQVAGQGLGGADKAGALTVFGGLHGGFGIEVALIFPEVRPEAAADDVEVTDFHDFLTTFAHEGEAVIEVE